MTIGNTSMKRIHISTTVLFMSILLALPAGAQSSQDGPAAQALFDRARALMDQGRAADACPKLEESQRLDPKSGTLLNLARCYEQVGKLASAWTKYLEAAPAAHAAGNLEREAVARERAGALVPRLSMLRVDIDPSLTGLQGLEVQKDGARVGSAQWGLELPADPGEHKLLARAPGYRSWETTVMVQGEGTVVRVAVPMLLVERGARPGLVLREPDAKPRGLGVQRMGAIVAGGVGLLGLGVGTYFGLDARTKQQAAEQNCTGSVCRNQTGLDTGKKARVSGDRSTIFMALGAAGVLTGVTLWFTAPDPEQ